LIAHGLAHHLFHKESKVNYFLEDKDNSFNNWMVKEHEKEAEVFAAYLLIPEDKLNVLMNEGWLENSSDPILELAEEFQVSKNFMRKRLILKRLFENNDKIKVNNYEIENCNN
jgi:Zn-dependent peptidase ImmA (M78 family)